MDWINLAQVGDQWQAVVSMIKDIWVPYKFGNF
jgi:hypothetical protein